MEAHIYHVGKATTASVQVPQCWHIDTWMWSGVHQFHLYNHSFRAMLVLDFEVEIVLQKYGFSGLDALALNKQSQRWDPMI